MTETKAETSLNPDQVDKEEKKKDATTAAESSEEDENAPTPVTTWICRGLVAFIVIGGIIFVIVRRDITKAVLEAFVLWLGENRWIGPIALFCIYAVAQACMIPGIALLLGAGFGLMKAY